MSKSTYSFKVFFFSYTILVALPIMSLVAILNCLHQVPVYFNGQSVYGVEGVLICIIATPLWGGFVAGINWVILTIGNKIFGRFQRKVDRKKVDSSNLS